MPATKQKAGPDEGTCAHAAAARVKYFLEERIVLPSEKGVDKKNRDNSLMNAHDVHALAEFIWAVGCDPREFERCVAVACGDAWHEQCAHMEAVCNSTDLLPHFGTEDAGKMTMTTLIGGHATMVNRCYLSGVICGHPNHANECGCMNLQHLEASGRRMWAKAVREGSKTTILASRIRTEDSSGMQAIIAADNMKHGANLVDHSINLIRRLGTICEAETRLAGSSTKDEILKRFMRTIEPSRYHEAQAWLAVWERCGGGAVIEEMEAFRAHCETKGVEIGAAFYARWAKLPMTMGPLRQALLKTQIMCPSWAVTPGSTQSDFIKAGDLESLREGGRKHAEAEACDAMLRRFRQDYAAELNNQPAAQRNVLLAKLDCQAVRALFQKCILRVCRGPGGEGRLLGGGARGRCCRIGPRAPWRGSKQEVCSSRGPKPRAPVPRPGPPSQGAAPGPGS